MQLTYTTKPFHALTSIELYRLLQLRQEVFVVEQECPYLDADGMDDKCIHVLGFTENAITEAYCRICPAGTSYEGYVSIGRVVTSKQIRKAGEGRRLMIYALEKAHKLFPNVPIKISAQTYLIKFYNSLGFQEVGKEYLEDGIPHVAMVK